MTALARTGLWLLAAAVASPPAQAQESGSATAPAADATAGEAADAVQASPVPLWTATTSAGISARENGPDGNWEALALTRQIGRGYIRASAMRYHGTLVQADAALPSDYFIGTLTVGGNFDGWVSDGWISYGRQEYGKISTSAGTRSSTGASGSAYFAVGGDFGKVLPLGHGWYVTPTVAASYAHGKLLRPAPADNDLTDLETDEPTWSANAAIRIDHSFGGQHQHYAGLSVSRNWSSNAVSDARPPASTNVEPTSLDSIHYADNWFEVGATANVALSSRLHLDLFATRGFGMLAGDTTSGGMSLRISF